MSGVADFITPYVEEKQHYRLVVAADGLDKNGKTHWSIMTPPDPVFVVTGDTGTMEIIKQAKAQGRKVDHMDISLPDTPSVSTKKKEDVDSTMKKLWVDEWDKFERLCRAMHDDKHYRTMVIDTGSMIKTINELAFFGKLRGNINQDIRTEANGAMHKLFWDLYKKRPDLNMIWIHQLKKKYEGSGNKATWTGEYERDGWNKIGYGVDVTVEFGWDPVRKDFYTTIPEKQPLRFMQRSADLMGKRWYAMIPGSVILPDTQESHFAVLGETIFPETAGVPGIWD